MNITRCGKEHLVLTIIIAIVSCGGLASAVASALRSLSAFDQLPLVAVSALGAAIVLRYRRYASVPKWMFYLWILPQAIYLEIAVRIGGAFQNIVPRFSILGEGYFAIGYAYDRVGSQGFRVGFYGLSFLLLAVFLVFLEEWDDEKDKAEPGATDNPDDAQRLREDH